MTEKIEIKKKREETPDLELDAIYSDPTFKDIAKTEVEDVLTRLEEERRGEEEVKAMEEKKKHVA